MAREDRPDAASRIGRVLVFVTRPYDDTEHPDQALVIVEEGVPGVRVFFDIMVDLASLECAIQPRRRALQHPVAAAEARDHRAGAIQDRINVVGSLRHSSGLLPPEGSQNRRAEADDPDLARAILAAFQSVPHNVDSVERRSLARRQIHHQGADATEAAAPREQVERASFLFVMNRE